MSEILISFAQEDRFIARRIGTLLAHHGYRVSFDLDVGAGVNWPAGVEAQIALAHAVVVLLSPSALRSSLVRAEVELAHRKERRVIPVWMQGAVDEDAALEWDASLENPIVVAADAPDFVEHLIGRLKARLEGAYAEREASRTKSRGQKPVRGSHRDCVEGEKLAGGMREHLRELVETYAAMAGSLDLFDHFLTKALAQERVAGPQAQAKRARAKRRRRTMKDEPQRSGVVNGAQGIGAQIEPRAYACLHANPGWTGAATDRSADACAALATKGLREVALALSGAEQRLFQSSLKLPAAWARRLLEDRWRQDRAHRLAGVGFIGCAPRSGRTLAQEAVAPHPRLGLMVDSASHVVVLGDVLADCVRAERSHWRWLSMAGPERAGRSGWELARSLLLYCEVLLTHAGLALPHVRRTLGDASPTLWRPWPEGDCEAGLLEGERSVSGDFRLPVFSSCEEIARAAEQRR